MQSTFKRVVDLSKDWVPVSSLITITRLSSLLYSPVGILCEPADVLDYNAIQIK